MRKLFGTLIFFFLTFIFSQAIAQVRVPFQERASQNNQSRKTFEIKGDFVLIGNTNLTLQNYGDNLMNDNLLIYVDVDGDSNTINSSSATLKFSNENGANTDCSQVLFAGMYWSGRGPTEDEFEVSKGSCINKKLDRRKVTLKGPTGITQTFTAKANDIRYTYGLDLPNDLGLFVGFVEVTDFVKNSGEGEYTVADLAAIEGTNYHYGGWSMVVVYENPSMINRSITVFDGYAFVRGSVVADYTIPISGFSTVDSGPVRMKLGVAAGEGDVAAFGDYFEIEKEEGSGNFIRLSHSGNSINNFFNSSISTGGNLRNPQLKNNTGMDISIFEIPNDNNEILKNGQTGTRFRYGTDGDAYVIYNIITAVEANEPLVEGYHYITPDANGEIPEIKPLDEIELEVEIRNLGQISIEKALLELNIPNGLEFVSAETEYFFSNSSGQLPEFSNGVLNWEIGDLPIPNSKDQILGKIAYKVKVTGQCNLLVQSCGLPFVLDGNIVGINSITGTSMATAPLKIGADEGGSCLESPIYGPVLLDVLAGEYLIQECGFDQANSLISICQPESNSVVNISKFNSLFPVGTRYFDSFPVSESTIEYVNEIPFNISQTYFAIPSDNPNCPKEFGLRSGFFDLEIEIEEAGCGGSITDRLVTFNSLNQDIAVSYDYLDGNGFVQDYSRSFPVGKHQVVAQNSLGCSQELEFEILPLQSFTVDIQKIGQKGICPDFSDFALSIAIDSEIEDTFYLTIEGTTGEGESFNFTNSNLSIGTFEFKEIGPGNYNIRVENTEGCSQSSNLIIENEDIAYLEANFEWKSSNINQSGSIEPNEIILFENLSIGSGQLDFTWDFGNGVMSSEFSPIHSYTEPGNYEIILSVNSSDGCFKEIKKIIEVGGPALRVPDAFAPDKNGSNDYFFPVFRQIESLKLWVFDRWGTLMFYSDSLTDKGWDGTVNGVNSSPGIYAYKVEYWAVGSQTKVVSGSFMLLR
ncbi:hypothetical protein P872_06770 [Rhodonellum psychrophilum GCM71 = DSM 17998]|uniref:PKD domain-containing protein n=2 Tax=Rhodonellum TaxID=336827 RepID=U5BWL5_9BACT|nr:MULTISPECIES: T9SS C-terminal target domain-containing protein [Rhodonellum]ERM81944.1 hypothetical protein P872_06770 [Rhodonellum psychrophilum GCM71 = DSM 17998]